MVKLTADMIHDLAVACDMASITYEQLAKESQLPEVSLFFLLKMAEVNYLARVLRGENLYDMARPVRYV